MCFTYCGSYSHGWLVFELGIRAGKSMETYLNNPDFYYREGEGGQFWLFGHNHMMFDLGFNCDLSDDEAISTAIEIVDKTYDLVMILGDMLG